MTIYSGLFGVGTEDHCAIDPSFNLDRSLAADSLGSERQLHALSDDELEQIIGKARRLKALQRAKERVKQLERELRGEPEKTEDLNHVPEFLRTPVTAGLANLTAVSTIRRRVSP